MHHFHYRDGVLHAEDVSLAQMAAEIGTPFFCYSTATIERHYRLFAEAASTSSEDIAGAVMLATAAVLLTAASVRFNKDQHALIVPAVFAAMFVASWSIR